jgi:glycosyltransferase involved in cell wall biosynthesis
VRCIDYRLARMILGINARFLAAPLGGVQRFAREVTDQLLGRCDVVLFTPRAVSLPPGWAARARAVVGGRLHGQLWEQIELPARARGSCDVLLHPANTAPLIRVAPQVVMVHDLLPLTHPQWFAPGFGRWYGRLMPRVVHSADSILTSSPDLIGPLRALLGHSRTPITIVPQGCPPFDAPAAADAIARVLAGRGIRAPYVLAVGAGEPRKNSDFATDVIRRYTAAHGTGVQLVLVGAAAAHVHAHSPLSNDDAPDVHARRPGPAGDPAVVRTLGRVTDPELHALYTGAVALLYPTLGEGFGRPPVEALCCGTPVMASLYAPGEQTLAGTGTRRLPLDADIWQRALRDIIQAGERVSSDVRRRLCELWSWETSADAVLEACAAAAGVSYANVANPLVR